MTVSQAIWKTINIDLFTFQMGKLFLSLSLALDYEKQQKKSNLTQICDGIGSQIMNWH